MPAPKPATAPLTLGILGLGRWGHQLAAAFARTGNSRILWHCDPDPARLAAAELPGGARRTGHHEDVVADPAVQAVIIATPPATHAPLALEALAAGKHVFVEKPMTTSLASADQLVAAVEATELTLMVGHILTFHPGHIELRRLAKKGVIGRVHTVVGQRWSPRYGRPPDDAWWSLAVHDVSLFGQLLEGEPTSAEVRGERVPGSTCYGRVSAELSYEGGVRGIVEASTVDELKVRRTLVAGDEGTLVLDELAVERGIAMYQATGVMADAFAAMAVSNAVRSFNVPAGEAMAAEARHFVDSVMSREAPMCGARDGWRTVGILDGAMGRMRTGQPASPAEQHGQRACATGSSFVR